MQLRTNGVAFALGESTEKTGSPASGPELHIRQFASSRRARTSSELVAGYMDIDAAVVIVHQVPEELLAGDLVIESNAADRRRPPGPRRAAGRRPGPRGAARRPPGQGGTLMQPTCVIKWWKLRRPELPYYFTNELDVERSKDVPRAYRGAVMGFVCLMQAHCLLTEEEVKQIEFILDAAIVRATSSKEGF